MFNSKELLKTNMIRTKAEHFALVYTTLQSMIRELVVEGAVRSTREVELPLFAYFRSRTVVTNSIYFKTSTKSTSATFFLVVRSQRAGAPK